jgi:hypothetical protein
MTKTKMRIDIKEVDSAAEEQSKEINANASLSSATIGRAPTRPRRPSNPLKSLKDLYKKAASRHSRSAAKKK